ncbi:MAG: hypothetical protein RLZZ84_120 [Pseudomonadota bacterium]|jgi:Flp pilus assembly protein TadD
MPLALALIAPLLAQVGPGTALPQAPLEIHHQRATGSATLTVIPNTNRPDTNQMDACLALAKTDPEAAIRSAQNWLGSLTGSARAEPAHCLGVALAALGRWNEAETAFRDARDDTPANERGSRAARGAMAGNAALAAGSADRALIALDLAHGDAQAAEMTELTGGIAVDRARALVALGRGDEAGNALSEARAKAPRNAQAWLLSATLARRERKLAEAQAEIEMAAQLLPVDPEIALEAGVIAVLSGRDAAARKSWASVIAVAPGSGFAKTAQTYLDQLGPPPPPSPR